MTDTKTCATCEQEKLISEFELIRNGSGYRYPRKHCRNCMNAMRRDKPMTPAAKARSRRHSAARRVQTAASREVDTFIGTRKQPAKTPLPTREELRGWFAAGCPL